MYVCFWQWFLTLFALKIYHFVPHYLCSDSPLDLKIKGNMLCDLFSLAGELEEKASWSA